MSGSGTESDTEDGSSTGPESGVPLRFIVTHSAYGDQGAGASYYELVDGVVSAAAPLFPEDFGESSRAVVSRSLTSTRFVAGIDDASAPDNAIRLYDLTAAGPVALQPAFVPPVPVDPNGWRIFFAGTPEKLLFDAEGGEDEPRHLYSSLLSERGLEPPVVVASPAPGADIEYWAGSGNGDFVTYQEVSADGVGELMMAPVDTPDPDAAVQLTDVGTPGLHAGYPLFAGQDALVYWVHGDGPTGGPFETLRWVDLSGPSPAPSVRIDEPLPAGPNVRRRSVRMAPDGRGVTYWITELADGELEGPNSRGDLMFVGLAGGTPGAPEVLSTAGARQVVSDEGIQLWSPDSRWFRYLAEHDLPGREDLYLVDTSGGALSDPIRVTDLVPGGELEYAKFDAESHWLYYTAQQDSEAVDLYRVDVSGDEIGPRQRISSGGDVKVVLYSDRDWTSIMFRVDEGEHIQLYRVDVSGARPGAPQRVNAPLGDGIDVEFAPSFTDDGRFVFYQETGPDFGSPTPLRIVDVTTGDVVAVAEDSEDVYELAIDP